MHKLPEIHLATLDCEILETGHFMRTFQEAGVMKTFQEAGIIITLTLQKRSKYTTSIREPLTSFTTDKPFDLGKNMKNFFKEGNRYDSWSVAQMRTKSEG